MNEEAVVAAMANYLQEQEFEVVLADGNQDPDMVATRNNERLIIEAKGDTGNNMGTDVDTGYGQILRRMNGEPCTTLYGLAFPANRRDVALRVPVLVRERLHIALYAVADGGVEIVR